MTMQPTAQPVAYIRRSVARTGDPGDVSREFQTETVRALAGEDAGPTLRIIDGDWGRSASTDKTHKREAFLGLLEAIERGEVSHVYAYAPDRLARSTEWSARLVNACRRALVPITTTAGVVAPDDPGARMLFNMLAVMNENALDGMERRSRDSVKVRRSRNVAAGLKPNEGMGRKPYGKAPGEDSQVVVDTFARVGSFLGTARALTAAGVPTRLGAAWDVRTVSRIVRRHSDLAPAGSGRRGARARSQRLFSGLLRCHCGDTLTSMPTAWSVRYYCRRAHLDPRHSRPYVVSETKVRAWAEPEAIRASKLIRALFAGAPDPAVVERQRAALDKKRARWIEQYGDDLIDKAKRDEKLAKIDREREAIDTRGRLVGARIDLAIVWDRDPGLVNRDLRTLWDRIVLGRDLLPVRAIWHPTDRYGEDGPMA